MRACAFLLVAACFLASNGRSTTPTVVGATATAAAAAAAAMSGSAAAAFLSPLQHGGHASQHRTAVSPLARPLPQLLPHSFLGPGRFGGSGPSVVGAAKSSTMARMHVRRTMARRGEEGMQGGNDAGAANALLAVGQRGATGGRGPTARGRGLAAEARRDGAVAERGSGDAEENGVSGGGNGGDDGPPPLLLALAGVAALVGGAAYALDLSAPVEFFKSFDVKALLEQVATQVDGLGPLGYVYFSAVYIAAEILALPAVPLTASAGYLFGALPGTCTVLVSATIAAGVSFLIGRTFLRKYIEDMAADNQTFRAIDAAVGREGFKVVLLLRLSPLLPFALSNYFYGLTSVEFGPYLLATLLGFAPGTFAYVYTGEAAKVLSTTGEMAGADDGAPWYVYAGALAALLAFSKVATNIASEALADIEDE